ncbi:MAG: hypothetical protein ABW173_03355 [Sphingomonas sp.]
MSALSDMATIARDPTWLPHRYDPGHDAVHFMRLDRAGHRARTFLTDAELPAAPPLVLARAPVVAAAAGAAAPIHFVFHSAYCCSTLVARALDRTGAAMALKEPQILNDLAGWRRRGAPPARLAEVLDGAVTLLARPFSTGEAVVAKPSNIVNPLAAVLLALRPQARALLLHAPLRLYLGSIARKGMWGRLWVRELFVGLAADGVTDLGFAPERHLEQTDLQIAALGWLAQHRLFAALARRHPDRVATLDSERLVAEPRAALAALAGLFGLPLDQAAIADIVGDVFARHAKSGETFGADARAADQRDAASVHGEEIEKVALWAEAVAESAGIPLRLPSPLL